jgi:hypothetical protein
MTRSRKLFVLFSVVFVGLLAYASYDISRKTTFPGAKPQLKERLKDKYLMPDSIKTDSSLGISGKY